jgi:hypothetical protein
MKTPHEFYLETDGKIIDIDGSYGGQCWDLFALFCQEYIGFYFSCLWTGYVEDFWYHFDELHLGVYFEQIPPEKYHELQDGDWLIWVKRTNQNCWITNSSHIGMFRKYNDTNPEQNIILHQTPNGNPNCTHQQVADFLGFVGALRPKCYITQDKNLPNPVEENKEVDQFKVNCNDTMFVRLDHKTSGESIGLAREGFYNILNRCDDDGYTWFEVEKNKWIALLPPYSDYIPKEEKPEPTPEPQPEPQPEPTPTPEPEPTPEPTPDENIFIKIIKFIIELIQKIFKKEN